jgi:DNA repair photolyase
MNIIYQPGGEALEYAYLGLNHYIGCNHRCSYCYMRAMDKRYGTLDFDNPRAKKDVLELLESDCQKIAGTEQRVHLCFATDAYQRIDQEHKLTREVIKLLRKHTIPFQVLTKGGECAGRDFDLYGRNDLFGVTLTSLREDWTIYHEPMAAPPSHRMAALHAAKQKRIKTWVSLEPVIDAAEAFRIIETTAGYVDLYKIGKLNHQKNPGVNWRQFAADVVGVCNRLGKKYFLKSSLAKYLDASAYENTDWRIIG